MKPLTNRLTRIQSTLRARQCIKEHVYYDTGTPLPQSLARQPWKKCWIHGLPLWYWTLEGRRRFDKSVSLKIRQSWKIGNYSKRW